MAEPITRRQFVGVGLALCAGIASVATTGCASNEDRPATVDTPAASYGEENAMGRRVLVGYATRTGSTADVANEIGRVLGDRGFQVDVRPLMDGPATDGYDAVVLGSAINGGRWLPEAVDYVKSNAGTLATCPTALFCVHAMNTSDTERARKKRLAYINDVRGQVAPSSEGFFAGVGPDAAETSAFTRWMFRAFGGDVEGDGRDWGKIRKWAGELPI